jgi:hypothetical protein
MLKELLAENVEGSAALPREQIVNSMFSFLRTGYLRTEGAGVAAPTNSVAPTPKPRARRKR